MLQHPGNVDRAWTLHAYLEICHSFEKFELSDTRLENYDELHNTVMWSWWKSDDNFKNLSCDNVCIPVYAYEEITIVWHDKSAQNDWSIHKNLTNWNPLYPALFCPTNLNANVEIFLLFSKSVKQNKTRRIADLYNTMQYASICRKWDILNFSGGACSGPPPPPPPPQWWYIYVPIFINFCVHVTEWW